MSGMQWSTDTSDLVDGRRFLTLVLLDKSGKELGRKAYHYSGEHPNCEYGTGVRARELYRDVFWDPNAPVYVPPPARKPRSYLWGLIEVYD